MDSLTQERLDREFKVTEHALKHAKIIIPKEHEHYKTAQKMVDTAQRYYDDACFFKEKQDKASAFGALNYAFGWLDAGREAKFIEPIDHLKE